MLYDLAIGGFIAVGIYYLYKVSSMIVFGLSWNLSGLCYLMEDIRVRCAESIRGSTG